MLVSIDMDDLTESGMVKVLLQDWSHHTELEDIEDQSTIDRVVICYMETIDNQYADIVDQTQKCIQLYNLDLRSEESLQSDLNLVIERFDDPDYDDQIENVKSSSELMEFFREIIEEEDKIFHNDTVSIVRTILSYL